jgi:hypothetical protein
MHDPLGDALTVEMRMLLEELPVLHQQRAARTGGQAVLIVADRNTGGARQTVFGFHAVLHRYFRTFLNLFRAERNVKARSKPV